MFESMNVSIHYFIDDDSSPLKKIYGELELWEKYRYLIFLFCCCSFTYDVHMIHLLIVARHEVFQEIYRYFHSLH